MRELVISKFYRTPEFMALNVEWNKKLKESGFKDAENQHPVDPWLNEWESVYFQIRNTPEDFGAKRRYFELAGQFGFVAENFKKKKHQRVWQLHAEGYSVRVTAKMLKMDRNTVWLIICRYREIMLKENDRE